MRPMRPVHRSRAHHVWQVTAEAWVALVFPPGSLGTLVGRDRRLGDRLAGRWAEVLALRAARMGRPDARISRSHSASAGAAAVAPDGWAIGVDVMPVSRVTARHASAVADDHELAVMERVVGSRRAPAVVWALKEAAMKAAGRPGLAMMRQWVLRHAFTDGSAELLHSRDHPCRVDGGWRIADDFVCAWAIRSSGRDRLTTPGDALHAI